MDYSQAADYNHKEGESMRPNNTTLHWTREIQLPTASGCEDPGAGSSEVSRVFCCLAAGLAIS